jgi:hypothetical protein
MICILERPAKRDKPLLKVADHGLELKDMGLYPVQGGLHLLQVALETICVWVSLRMIF